MKEFLGTPTFIYGTAWKKERTTELTRQAYEAGFRAFDTANQLKHYDEALMGEALQNFPREELWIQSKFTPKNGQDHRLPYDPQASLGEQVRQSFENSLLHLRTDYLDSYLLHGPYHYPGLGDEDFEVWRSMQTIKESGRAREIGISNVNAQQLSELLAKAHITPSFVQNRCYAKHGWDLEVRRLCQQSKIRYQGFSLLTANPQILAHHQCLQLARKYQVEAAQIIFRFAQDMGMLPLTGTTNPDRMRADLGISAFTLEASEIQLLEKLGV